MPMTLVKARERSVQQCIDDCVDCHSVCMETIVYSLELGKEHAEAAHIRQLYACAEICNTMANFARLATKGTSSLASTCSEVCDRCAESCERFTNDRPLIACAEECRKCSASCKTLAKMNLF